VDHRSRFYECYHKEAEDYDRDYIEKRDGDLNATLVPVSSASSMSAHVLNGAGWSVIRCDFRVHHLHPPLARTRPK